MRSAIICLLTAALGATSTVCSPQSSSVPPSEGISTRAPKVSPPTVPQQEPTVDARARVPSSLIEKMRRDLAQKVGAEAAAATVVRAESVTWSDGSLGCHEPGQMYTQQLVRGYRVELAIGEQRYSYHASAESGYFKLCRKLPRSLQE